MKAKVLGIQNVDFVNSQTGERIVGYRLHLCYKDPDVTGERVDPRFFGDRLGLGPVISTLKPGVMVDLDTNPRGRVIGITPIQ